LRTLSQLAFTPLVATESQPGCSVDERDAQHVERAVHWGALPLPPPPVVGPTLTAPASIVVPPLKLTLVLHSDWQEVLLHVALPRAVAHAGVADCSQLLMQAEFEQSHAWKHWKNAPHAATIGATSEAQELSWHVKQAVTCVGGFWQRGIEADAPPPVRSPDDGGMSVEAGGVSVLEGAWSPPPTGLEMTVPPPPHAPVASRRDAKVARRGRMSEVV
jgi:hypothetical protein